MQPKNPRFQTQKGYQTNKSLWVTRELSKSHGPGRVGEAPGVAEGSPEPGSLPSTPMDETPLEKTWRKMDLPNSNI